MECTRLEFIIDKAGLLKMNLTPYDHHHRHRHHDNTIKTCCSSCTQEDNLLSPCFGVRIHIGDPYHPEGCIPAQHNDSS